MATNEFCKVAVNGQWREGRLISRVNSEQVLVEVDGQTRLVEARSVRGSEGWVYLIRARHARGRRPGTYRYKIGLTQRQTVEDRLKELNSGQSPYYLELVEAVWVEDCFKVEEELHEKYRHLNVRDCPEMSSSEWFEFKREKLKGAIADLKANRPKIDLINWAHRKAAEVCQELVRGRLPKVPRFSKRDVDIYLYGVASGAILIILAIGLSFGAVRAVLVGLSRLDRSIPSEVRSPD